MVSPPPGMDESAPDATGVTPAVPTNSMRSAWLSDARTTCVGWKPMTCPPAVNCSIGTGAEARAAWVAGGADIKHSAMQRTIEPKRIERFAIFPYCRVIQAITGRPTACASAASRGAAERRQGPARGGRPGGSRSRVPWRCDALSFRVPVGHVRT
jgi:hypothetical protein